MGISVPTTNLKKYNYINLADTLAITFAVPFAHYLFLQDVNLSEIDELLVYITHRSFAANVTSEVSVELDRVTSLANDNITNSISQWFEFINVTGYTGVHELGLLWDISGAGLPGQCSISYAYVWGKKGLV